MNDKETSSFVTRIAPTPSGYLHSGNAFSFVLTWLICRKRDGKLLLRIDDNDASRSRPEFLDDIFYTLEWLGIDYDLGPQGPDDFTTRFSQHKRRDIYESFLADLLRNTNLVYFCSCSRKEIQANNKTGIYSGTCRGKKLKAGLKNVALRIEVPENQEVTFKDWPSGAHKTLFPGRNMGDFIVRRKDGFPSYQLVSLVDDIDYGVNFIVRGCDLQDSTAAQIYLAQLMGMKAGKWQAGAIAFLATAFLHHPLLLDSEGQKLSKSKGAASVHKMREAGKKPLEIYRMVAKYCGLRAEEIENLEDLLQQFSLKNFLKQQQSDRG